MPRAGRRLMAAAAKLRGDVVDVHLVVLGAKADARDFRFDFLEDAGDHDRRDGADVINQSLGVVALARRRG